MLTCVLFLTSRYFNKGDHYSFIAQHMFSSISALCSYLLVHKKKIIKKTSACALYCDLELHNILVGYVHLRDVL